MQTPRAGGRGEVFDSWRAAESRRSHRQPPRAFSHPSRPTARDLTAQPRDPTARRCVSASPTRRYALSGGLRVSARTTPRSTAGCDGAVAELEHVTGEVSPPSLVDRSDDLILGFEQHLSSSGVGDGAARGQRGYPRARRRQHVVDRVGGSAHRAVRALSKAFRSMAMPASKSARGRRDRPGADQCEARRSIRAATGDDLLRQHVVQLRMAGSSSPPARERRAFDLSSRDNGKSAWACADRGPTMTRCSWQPARRADLAADRHHRYRCRASSDAVAPIPWLYRALAAARREPASLAGCRDARRSAPHRSVRQLPGARSASRRVLKIRVVRCASTSAAVKPARPRATSLLRAATTAF